MNFFSNYRFTLDIQKGKSQASIPVHYGDTGNRFYITLTDGGNPYIIPDGCRVDLYVKKPAQHNPLINSCIIENNTLVRYEFNKNTASVEGMHNCELRLYSHDGRLITTPSFIMVVDQRVVYDDEIGTKEDFQKLYAMHVIANEEERIEAEAERKEAEKARFEAEIERERAEAARRECFDLVITSEEEFDKIIYPLYKNDEYITRDQAVLMVADDSAFNVPDSDFTYKRVIVKGVTFYKMRGYDDVRLHIFQPSIEYIKFDDCHWKTHWKVSGKNPRDASAANYNLNSTYTPDANTGKPRATAFNRAKGDLHLTIAGIHVAEENVRSAPISPAEWGIGIRNVKAIQDVSIDYPGDFRLSSDGEYSFKISCQFFDSAHNCKITSLWDGNNISDCYVTEKLKRNTNVVNVKAISIINYNGENVPVIVDSCKNIANLSGLFEFNNCSAKSATVEEMNSAIRDANQYAESYAEQYGQDHFVPQIVASPFTDGIMLYGKLPNGQHALKHARASANANEIVIRDTNGKVANSWQDNLSDYENGKWGKGVCMPRDYIDRKFKNYAPISNGKIPETYLPSYVDDVIEGYYFEKDGNHYFGSADFIIDSAYTPESGKIYVDKKTNKSYRWSGSAYVDIAGGVALGETSSTAFYGDKGKEAYDHAQITEGNPHGTTAANVGAVEKLTPAPGNRYIYATGWGVKDTSPIYVDYGDGMAGRVPVYYAPDAEVSDAPKAFLVTAYPTRPGHAANKKYVDDCVAKVKYINYVELGNEGKTVIFFSYVSSDPDNTADTLLAKIKNTMPTGVWIPASGLMALDGMSRSIIAVKHVDDGLLNFRYVLDLKGATTAWTLDEDFIQSITTVPLVIE